MLAPLADELAAAEAAMMDLLQQVADPREADELLDQFEATLGPDIAVTAMPDLAARRRSAHQRWTYRGGASIPFLTGVAAKLGYAVQIEELRPSICGRARCGDRLTPDGEIFTWIVHVPALSAPVLEVVLADLAPEHTTVVFRYEAT